MVDGAVAVPQGVGTGSVALTVAVWDPDGSHGGDLAVVDAVAGRTVVLQAGRVVEEGATAQVLAAPRQEYTRRLVAAVPLPDPVLQAGRRERRLAATC